ncbi:MAG: GNAT family N-acetyltransferase [Elusimicrobia bacterium]|nr:MAG: GNAT family N-acetyltransferase [Elusimicrobiota bacterium]
MPPSKGSHSERPPLSNVEELNKDHNRSRFDSSAADLDEWLKRFSLQSMKKDSARTFVVHRSGIVVGYYALTAGSASHEEATAATKKGLPQYPIPVIIIARLAIDRQEQGTGLGSALLKDALIRIETASKDIGIRAVLVHAINSDARKFYENNDFERSPINEFTLMLSMKDLRANLPN